MKEIHIDYQQKYYQEHKDKFKEYGRKTYEKNKEKCREEGCYLDNGGYRYMTCNYDSDGVCIKCGRKLR